MEGLTHLDPDLPKTRAVEAVIRAAVADGAFRVGARLPSTRDLAAELGVARNTVVSALDDLVAEGVLEARARSGIYVARPSRPAQAAELRSVEASPRVDLRPGRPERGSFPATRWLAAVRRSASSPRRSAPEALQVAGAVELRVQLAAYLARARGVETDASRIVICSGFRGATTVLAAAFAALGARTVAIEDPSLVAVDTAWRVMGLTVDDLPVDADGARIEELARHADVAVLTPSHQFPLGGALSPQRRQLVCDWARASDAFVVEDDYDGEFRFDRRPVAALQRSDPDRVIYVGTAGKTLNPGLRLGWMALPADLVGPVVDASEKLTGGIPVLNQLALADLIATGEYERHIRRQRREYARRSVLLRSSLHGIGIDSPGIPAGLHARVPLPASTDAADLARRLGRDHGIALLSLDAYLRSHALPPELIVGFAAPSRSGFGQAVDALMAQLRGLSDA